MADIDKITKTKLKAKESTSPVVPPLEPGEIRALTKSRLIGNISGGGSGSSSENKIMLLNSDNNNITLTKEQFDTLISNPDYIIMVKDNNRDTQGMWLGFYDYDADHGDLSIGMQVFTLNGFVKMLNICSFTKDTLTSNYTQALGAGIIPVTQFDAVFSIATPDGSIQIPLASIPSLSTTLSTQESDFTTITLTDEDIAMVKGKENGLLYANVEASGLAIGKNLFGVTLLQENIYLLTYISGELATVLAFEGGAPASVNFVIDVSTKHITQFAKTLALTNVSSLIITKANKIYLSSGVQEEGLDPDPLNKQYYFDTINGKPIIHESSTINNYDIKTYYNHFIKITGNASEVDSGQNIIARFTIQSSNNLVVDTSEKLSTLLGEEFELGCNGLYSNHNITGLKKTVDGTLSIIYNNGGVESSLSTTGITLTITDTVKII